MIGRDAYAVIASALGRANTALVSGYGDLIKNPGAMLDIEVALCKLREATLFSNDDYTKILDTNDGLYEPRFLVFEDPDLIGFGIQGSQLDMTQASAYPFNTTATTWSPDFGPFCPEGWGIYYYNAWSSWPVAAPSIGYEDGNYHLRSSYNYPVAYEGSGVYSRVGFFERARWISFLNNTGLDITSGETVIFLPSSELEGVQILRPNAAIADEVPTDVRVYGHPNLMQTYTNGVWGSIVTPNTPFTMLSTKWEAATGGWNLVLSLPNGFTWPNGSYWHVVMYWGTKDGFALSSNPFTSYTPSARKTVPNLLWTTKSFFRNDVNTQLQWTSLGITDHSNGYLVAQDRTHYSFADATYLQIESPTKYGLLDLPQALPLGVAKSLTEYTEDIPYGCAVPISICVETVGENYGTPLANPTVVVGPLVPPELWPTEWDGFYAFPKAPVDNVVIAQVVLVRAPSSAYKIAENRQFNFGVSLSYLESNGIETQTIYCKTAIEWMNLIPQSFAVPPLGSMRLAKYLIPSVTRATQRLRQFLTNNPLNTAGFSILVPEAGVPSSITSSVQALSDPTSLGSSVFRGLLKTPVDDILTPTDGALAFDVDASRLLSQMAGQDPSTELVRLDVNYLHLTGRELFTAGPLEIYMDPSDQCTIVDPNSAGDNVGLDYTFRLIMADADENVYTKDWYIMASKFYLTDGEWDNMVAKGLSTAGYFKASTLTNMPDYALFGTAGIVPNLTMGDSVVLTMRNELIVNTDSDGNQTVTVGPNALPNNFVSVRSVRVCVTKYATFDQPYWTINLNGFFGLHGPEDGSGTQAVDPQDARADSFTIAPSGLNPGDLEQFGNNSPAVSDSGLDYTPNINTDLAIADGSIAIKFNPQNNTTVSGFDLQLKSVITKSGGTALTNPSGVGLVCSIWSDANGAPFQQLSAGSSVDYASILPDTFTSYRFSINQVFSAGETYWLRIDEMAAPIGGFVSLNGYTSGWNTPQMIEYDIADSTWIVSGGTAWIIATNNGSSVLTASFDPTSTTGVDQPLLYNSSAIKMTVAGAFTQFSVRLRLTANATYAAGSSITVGICSNNGGVPGTTITTFPLLLNGLTSSYQQFKFTLTNAYSQGVYWVTLTNTRITTGYICLNVNGSPTSTMLSYRDSAWQPMLGAPYAQFFKIPIKMYGAFNRNSTDVDGSLPGPFNQRTYIGPGQQSSTYKVDSWCSFNCDDINPPSEMSLYPRAFLNPATGTWEYANFNQNCYAVVNYIQGGKLLSQNITIPSAPGWRSMFWNKTINDYNIIDTTVTPNIDQVVAQLDLLNYSGLGALTTYYNAVFEGSFAPWFSEAYTIQIVCQGGCRLYFNGDTSPDMDSWLTGGSPSNFTTPVLTAGTQYTIRIEYYVANTAQQLYVYWSSLHQAFGYLGEATAQVPTPSPFAIGSGDITNIAYIAVGKTPQEINTYTDGAPPGDTLVIRSS